MTEELTPTIEVLREIYSKPEEFEFCIEGRRFDFDKYGKQTDALLAWAINERGGMSFRRKPWVPEVGKLIYVSDHGVSWAVLKFKSMINNDYLTKDGLTWKLARPIPPEDVSK